MNIWMYAFFWFDKTANGGIFLGSFKARAFDSNLSQDWFIHTGFSDLGLFSKSQQRLKCKALSV